MGRKGNRIAELRNSNISLTFTSGLESFTDGWPMETYMFLFEYRLPKEKCIFTHLCLKMIQPNDIFSIQNIFAT